jgi:hypothetical protein
VGVVDVPQPSGHRRDLRSKSREGRLDVLRE